LSRIKSVVAVLVALTGLLVLATSASAHVRGDRNHDGIPDRWEKRHHLSLHVNQARRDQDHDGLKNRAEWRAGDNPRKADSDGDGIEDGAENTGTILSFDGTVLKITVFGQSDPLVGQVDQSTEIECDTSTSTATTSDDPSGSGDDQGDDQGDEQGDTTGDQGDDNDQGDDQGDEQGDDNDDQGEDQSSCGTAQLTPGATVKEAEVKLENGAAVFEKIELGS
jgi:hypothetical protein